MSNKYRLLPLATIFLCSNAVYGFSFQGESISGSFDSTVSTGLGVRASDPLCSHVIGSYAGSTLATPPSGPGAPEGCADALSGYNDQGNLNYAKGDAFTTYLKGTHELLLKMPYEIKFMGRVSWLKDFTATDTTGILSGLGSTRPFSDAAEDELDTKTRLLDLWVSKEFLVGDERARIRVGKQVLNWGESLFLPGGINQTNAVDVMRLSQPGTQLKEAVLPVPMIDANMGLGNGFSVEAYVQRGWRSNYFPPVGSYWSTASIGTGAEAYGFPTGRTPRKTGQYGVALRQQLSSLPLSWGVYYMNYHDTIPVVVNSLSSTSGFEYAYLEDRKLYGVSANFSLGNWAIGTELSYRPKDAVALNASAPGLGVNTLTGTLGTNSCLANGNCYVEEEKYQFHLTGLLSLTPSDYGTILKLLGANTATFMAEGVMIHYPNLKSQYNGVPIAAGGWGWGYQSTEAVNATGFNVPDGVGSKTSTGFAMDFSWIYDGNVIPGWQMIPEIYYFQALSGRTPSLSGTFMKGARSANFIISFIKNPATWQMSVNYARFWGGDTLFDQPLKDRNFFGATISRNF